MAQRAGLRHYLELAEVSSSQRRMFENILDHLNGDRGVGLHVHRLEDESLSAAPAELDEFVGGPDLLGNLLLEGGHLTARCM